MEGQWLAQCHATSWGQVKNSRLKPEALGSFLWTSLTLPEQRVV